MSELLEPDTIWTADLNVLRDIVHEMAVRKDWHTTKRTDGELFMLMVTEVAEAMEEVRDHHAPDEMYYGEDGKPEGVPSELADVVIRILDYCGLHGIDIAKAVAEKIFYNHTRPKRHGGKAS